MVLGMRSKNHRRPTSVHVDYTIHIQEIRPWPPSQSLKSLKSVVLQWENGDRSSGSTGPVTPSQSKIEFNESFNLHATLLKESSGKGNGFQKNVLELSLYEPRRDKSAKGQLLGSALVDLAEHGVIKDVASFGVPLSCKRSYRNTAQPVVYVSIQAFDQESASASASSSFRERLSKEESLDSEGMESVSALMSEEYAEEAEIASFTDDDVSSQSSLGNLASSSSEVNAELAARSSPEQQKKETCAENERKDKMNLTVKSVPISQELEMITAVQVSNGIGIHEDRSLPHSINAEISDDGNTSLSTSLEKSDLPCSHSLPSSATYGAVIKYDLRKDVQEKVEEINGEEYVLEEARGPVAFNNQHEMLKPERTDEYKPSTDDSRVSETIDDTDRGICTDDTHDIFVEESIKEKQRENGLEENTEAVENHLNETESSANSSPDNGSMSSRESLEHTPVIRHKYLRNALRKPVNSDVTTSGQGLLGEKGSKSLTSDRMKNMQRSMRSPPHALGSLGSLRHAAADQYVGDVKETDFSEDLGIITLNSSKMKQASRGNVNSVPTEKVRELELRVEMLEGELREAAAIEISLYSIVAEHGSSVHKVHTPARRLSRLYIHASKQWSRERKASAARSAVSGLILAAKACGNDVPRLTFWLSNAIVLRAIVTAAVENSDISNNVRPHSASNGSRLMANGKSPPLKWESLCYKKQTLSPSKEFDDWDLSTFTAALERIESWMFSRIIESIWWQTLTPHMQSIDGASESKTDSNKNKNFGRQPSLGDKRNENFSIEVWKKAFSDACERLCPVRAEGHECGCLHMLARLVMEQCVARLDVAMFNAILRESADEIPTDPVSDPISDPRVLPIPPGKSSFGAGAQLKNAIGNWSRWLTDLFGMDTDEYPQDKNGQDDDRLDFVESFKSFRLLNALSDLLMLPKDMLLDKSIRKEVCPTFSTSMIKRILISFLPDEFCPDAIPYEVLEALDSEDTLESDEEEISHYPCDAYPISYSAPSVASVENIVGDVRTASVLRRSGSSVVRKCHTSDDELDELDSPLSSIMLENSFTPTAMSKGSSSANVVRYQLLRDVWRNDD